QYDPSAATSTSGDWNSTGEKTAVPGPHLANGIASLQVRADRISDRIEFRIPGGQILQGGGSTLSFDHDYEWWGGLDDALKTAVVGGAAGFTGGFAVGCAVFGAPSLSTLCVPGGLLVGTVAGIGGTVVGFVWDPVKTSVEWGWDHLTGAVTGDDPDTDRWDARSYHWDGLIDSGVSEIEIAGYGGSNDFKDNPPHVEKHVIFLPKVVNGKPFMKLVQEKFGYGTEWRSGEFALGTPSADRAAYKYMFVRVRADIVKNHLEFSFAKGNNVVASTNGGNGDFGRNEREDSSHRWHVSAWVPTDIDKIVLGAGDPVGERNSDFYRPDKMDNVEILAYAVPKDFTGTSSATTNARIRVHVTNQNGGNVEGADVTVRSGDSATSCTTDITGFPKTNSGGYSSKDGFALGKFYSATASKTGCTVKTAAACAAGADSGVCSGTACIDRDVVLQC
ncbi:MAG: hypothetical protein HY366_01420, partial [Candidatus Aenigmarchaeota archaeon]|nr:hypothetical protein [Candidatus Aenigmarchaeota archaeon]